MKKIFICCLLFFVSCISVAQLSREEKLQQLKNRTDIKVAEIQNDILKLEYPNGKVLYKNISDYEYRESGIQQPITYSPTYDSTIIDLTTIDTIIYYHKYKFWQEVPIHNWDFNFVRIGDVNNNGKPELYGPRKFFNSDYEPVTVYELNENGGFDSVYQYDSFGTARNIYDVNGDGEEDLHLTTQGMFGPFQQRFFSKTADTSLASDLNFIFSPYPEQFPQLNNQMLGDFDRDGYTDLIFSRSSTPYVYISEYNPIINNLDSIYRFQAEDGKGGFSISDFDLDGKTEMVFGTINGNVFVIENDSNNLYTNSWQGTVESNNAYIHTWTNDIDKNGKPEFCVLADAYYNGIGTTRITIFETNGDNSYQAVGRIDLVGIFSFYAGNMQAVDIDNDGTEEIAVCIDGNFVILKFNGSQNHQTYEVYYIKQNNYENFTEYYGAIMYDLNNDSKQEVLLSQFQDPPQPDYIRMFTEIYKPDSTTSVDYDMILPLETNLYQNYPNPFNPRTIISYSIKEEGFVTLKVYDVLGKEVATLVKENKSTGNYEAEFNASQLSSGMYIYKLQAGSFTAVKKMLLTK